MILPPGNQGGSSVASTTVVPGGAEDASQIIPSNQAAPPKTVRELLRKLVDEGKTRVEICVELDIGLVELHREERSYYTVHIRPTKEWLSHHHKEGIPIHMPCRSKLGLGWKCKKCGKRIPKEALIALEGQRYVVLGA